MSVQPQPWPQPDPQIVAAVRMMYSGRREAPLAVQVRDRLGELFPDAAFADGFGRAGKPGWSPGRLALVTVLQKATNLTDRQAADEVRENLSWKYALGLALEDPKGRRLSLYPRELTEAVRTARAQQQDGTWQRNYALRAGVEGAIRQATHTTGLRRARYRGLAKTHLDHTTGAAALNLIRLHAWWHGRPLDRTNHCHLARLQLRLTA